MLLISPSSATASYRCVRAALADAHQLIRCHKCGCVSSTCTPGAVSVADHAADAVDLLDYLAVRRAHVGGHSTGATLAAQLALEHADTIDTLTLLEMSLVFSSTAPPSCRAAWPLRRTATAIPDGPWPVPYPRQRPALGRVPSQDREGRPRSGWQAVKDADIFFGVELPALTRCEFGAE